MCVAAAVLGPLLAAWAAAQSDNEPVTVGLVTPDSAATEGTRATTTAERFAEALNKTGGLLGHTIRVQSLSDACTRNGSEEAARELTAAKTALVIGHSCASAAFSAAPIYAKSGMLFMAMSRHPRLNGPRAGPTVFRLAGRDDRAGLDTVAMLRARFPNARIGIVTDKSIQARRFADDVARELARSSVKPALHELLVAGETNYQRIVDRLKAAAIDVVVVPALPVELGIVMDRLAASGHAATFVGSEILAVPTLDPIAQRHAAGLILMLPAPPRRVQPAPDAASTETDEQASDIVDAGLTAWAAAVTTAGTFDAKRIASVLETTAAHTVVGPLRFDIKGDAMISSYAPHMWKAGRWVALAP